MLAILDMNECNFDSGRFLEEESMVTWFLSIISYCDNYNINCYAMINNYLPYSIEVSNKNSIRELIKYLLNNYSLGIEGLNKFIVKNKDIINTKQFIIIIVYRCNNELIYALEKSIGKDKMIQIWCLENYVDNLKSENIIIKKQEL